MYLYILCTYIIADAGTRTRRCRQYTHAHTLYTIQYVIHNNIILNNMLYIIAGAGTRTRRCRQYTHIYLIAYSIYFVIVIGHRLAHNIYATFSILSIHTLAGAGTRTLRCRSGGCSTSSGATAAPPRAGSATSGPSTPSRYG